MIKTFILAAAFSSCLNKEPFPKPPQPEWQGSCASACENLLRLDCEMGKPSPLGSTCEDICEHVHSLGHVGMPLECITGAESCEEADACETALP